MGMSSPDSHGASSGGCQVCRTCLRQGSDSEEVRPRLSSSPRPPLRLMSLPEQMKALAQRLQ